MKESFSIKNSSEFAAVFENRCSASDGLIILFAKKTDRPTARLGLSISRKFGCAARRVRWKRLVREAFRQARPALGSGVDLVVVPGKHRRANRLEDFQKSFQKLIPVVAKKLKRDIITQIVE
ncbi:MAG: ribonuclease P protein component [Planctomycetia bacterium]|nr:ribonuclease P protein component [Planctomycetia bacterium]